MLNHATTHSRDRYAIHTNLNLTLDSDIIRTQEGKFVSLQHSCIKKVEFEKSIFHIDYNRNNAAQSGKDWDID